MVISGGFAETGPEGVRLQQHIVDTARSGGLRLVGPNCFGIINTRNGLNASLETSLLWALTLGACAAGLAYSQANR